ncbi:MAG: DUF1549 domain-containing protein, partial [Verrucomicrobiota bacterium]
MTSKLMAKGPVLFLWAMATAEAEPVDFDRDVQPIIATHCLACHGPDEQARKGDLRLDFQEDVFAERDGYRVVDRAHPDRSELLKRITHQDPDKKMPPPSAARDLSTAEIGVLERWVREGGVWEEHWAFRVPVRPGLPGVTDRAWLSNGLDAFVRNRLEEEGLEPSAPAGKRALIRRVTLGLTGLPPTLEEVEGFLADDSPEAYGKLVDRLLESPRYGEHMALAWLDAARYADTSGYQADWERHMWPWRDWVVRALNENMPFDQFTIEQLAGDLLPEATFSQRLATGFNRNHRINDEGGSLDAEFEVEYVVDRVDTTATVWLGLSAGCARCHDHKFDPISQKEFYQLYAFFNNVPEKGIDGRKGAARPFIEVPDERLLSEVGPLKAGLDQLRGDYDRLEDGEARSDLKKTIEAKEKELKKLERRSRTQVQVMEEREGEPRPTYLLVRGDYRQPDRSEVLTPALPGVFGELPEKEAADRLSLARWLTGG